MVGGIISMVSQEWEMIRIERHLCQWNICQIIISRKFHVAIIIALSQKKMEIYSCVEIMNMDKLEFRKSKIKDNLLLCFKQEKQILLICITKAIISFIIKITLLILSVKILTTSIIREINQLFSFKIFNAIDTLHCV